MTGPGNGAVLHVPDRAERDDLGAFAARVVRLDAAARVVLRAVRRGDGVEAWAPTPFDALATRAVRGSLDRPELAVGASELLTTLTVGRAERLTLTPAGPDPLDLPPQEGWRAVDDVPAVEVEALAERGVSLAREHTGPHGPPAALLDQVVLTVTGADVPAPVRVPLRCLFALSGMGFLGESGDPVRVSATGSWLRLDARFGAVARRRVTALPLLVG